MHRKRVKPKIRHRNAPSSNSNLRFALADGLVEAGQPLSARGGLDPEAELAEVDGLLVQVHAVEVVLENLPVEVEEGAPAAQFLQAGVGEVIDGVELFEGFDENRAAAAGRVENAQVLEFLLPGFPEADESLALGFVEGGQVISLFGYRGGPRTRACLIAGPGVRWFVGASAPICLIQMLTPATFRPCLLLPATP